MDRSLHKIKSDPVDDDPGLTLGQIIEQRLAELDWSHSDLARRMRRIDRTAAEYDSLLPMISKWKSDKIKPGRHNMRLLAKAMGVEISLLQALRDRRSTRARAERRDPRRTSDVNDNP
jgi:transcriptional regulator with XRE-family HTH domain